MAYALCMQTVTGENSCGAPALNAIYPQTRRKEMRVLHYVSRVLLEIQSSV